MKQATVKNERKYELIKEATITVEGNKLYRVKALKDSKFFKAGDIGGYIEKVENLSMFDDAWVSGDAHVFGDAQVHGQMDIITVLDIGSERGCLTIHRDSAIGVRVTRGCFTGSIGEFLNAVELTHGDNIHGKIYKSLIETAKIQFGLE